MLFTLDSCVKKIWWEKRAQPPLLSNQLIEENIEALENECIRILPCEKDPASTNYIENTLQMTPYATNFYINNLAR